MLPICAANWSGGGRESRTIKLSYQRYARLTHRGPGKELCFFCKKALLPSNDLQRDVPPVRCAVAE